MSVRGEICVWIRRRGTQTRGDLGNSVGSCHSGHGVLLATRGYRAHVNGLHSLVISSLVVALSIMSTHEASAVQQPTHLVGQPELEFASGQAARKQRALHWGAAPAMRAKHWARFLREVGSQWVAVWDRATEAPARIWGQGVPVPGSVASPAIAEAFAREFLVRHIGLLAPGAVATDFVLVANVSRDGMRTLGFRQYWHGLVVVGGQVSFRFKNDRMFMVGVEAIAMTGRPAARKITDEQASGVATDWVLADMGTTAVVKSVAGPMALPEIAAAGVRHVHTVLEVMVSATKPMGLWRVYIDVGTGKPIARQQTLRFATATVHFNAPIRHPGSERQDYPARSASHLVSGAPIVSDQNGIVSWSGANASDLTLRATGPRVKVDNNLGNRTLPITAEPDATVVWNAADDEGLDAQLTAYVHADIAKEYSRSFANGLRFLDEQLPVAVNLDSQCNAFSDGTSVNFFVSSNQCQNTGRLADVVYHEFGHSLHAHSIIDGVGAFDGGLSEGLSDYLAATITNDPGMGRGFFYTNGPLRHIDPDDTEARWPEDVGEVHKTGLIIAGALWDLRKQLVAKLGQQAGVAQANKLFFAAMQRATDIPTSFAEVLAADDDDGNLSNGTPNFCLINDTFGAHGLRSIPHEAQTPAVVSVDLESYLVSVKLPGFLPICDGDRVESSSLIWRTRSNPDDTTQAALVQNEDRYDGTIPKAAPGTVIQAQMELTFTNGATLRFPDNSADPWYEFYVGEVIPLYCTDFETDPFQDGGWTHELAAGEEREGADDWQWGVPQSVSGSGDPQVAFSGERVLGNDLGGGDYNGQYQADKVNFALSPVVDLQSYSDVRLQYRRWLNVEDGFFDKATIYANDEKIWQNLNSDNGDASSTHHNDKEWRFHDVAISQFASSGSVQIKYELASDGGLEMGGWTIDDFCIVASAGAVCGNGNVDGSEACDDGDDNSDTQPNACRTSCVRPVCGDGVVDEGETCDDGNRLNDDECNNACRPFSEEEGDCGCRSEPTKSTAGGYLLLLLMVIVGVRRCRRRRV